jgi:hypothetical protein
MSAVFELLFLQSAGLVFWNEDAPDDFDRRQAFYGSPDDCKVRQRFADRIEYYLPIGDRGLIYTDEEDSTADTVSMKYAAVQRSADSWRLETPVQIKPSIAGGGFSIIGKDPMLLLFLIRQGPESGTYVFGSLPF